MVGYFIFGSADECFKLFGKYINEMSNQKKIVIGEKQYSNEVKLILIQYIVEGRFTPFPKKEYRYLSYRPKENAAAIEVGVSKNFLDFNDEERKNFIITSTMTSLEVTRQKLQKKNIEIDKYDLLLEDLNIAFNRFKNAQVISEN